MSKERLGGKEQMDLKGQQKKILKQKETEFLRNP